ncbi:hypothetical protein LDENG_00261930 [Lucifuga dentata]|nr:hypothetical protein LDENG_00261930 [Lucifuga dentata]
MDLVCTSGITISNLSSTDLTISHYLAIILDINHPTPLPKQKCSISFRNLKSLNPTSLSSSLDDAIPSSLLPQAGSHDPKLLFTIINKLLKPMDDIFNSFTTDKCNKFLSFFKNKNETIHNQLASSSTAHLPQEPNQEEPEYSSHPHLT